MDFVSDMRVLSAANCVCGEDESLPAVPTDCEDASRQGKGEVNALQLVLSCFDM